MAIIRHKSVQRRTVMKGASALALTAAAGACARQAAAPFSEAPTWMTLLGKSEAGGRDYIPRVEGELPAGLLGSLYRNGPGLFERGGVRIRHLLDGDGLVQRLSFSAGGVRYQNKFVRTQKFREEELANKRRYATWTTRKSNNFLDNLGGGVTQSQAGVTVYPVHGKIIARDELGPSYEVDAETLETLETIPAGQGLESVGFKAHSKLDPETGEWIMAGSQFGRVMKIHAAIYEPTLKLKTQFSFESPRQVYIHDFIATKSHLIFVLHPCYFSPLPFLSGMKSFTDSFSWKGDDGNLIAIVPRAGGEAKFFDAPGSFMWHALNAYEEGGEIIADIVGYDEPDHFIGDNAFFYNIMKGRMGRASSAGMIRRYRINLNAGSLKEEILDSGSHEFPMIDERVAMTAQRIGYFSCGGLGAFNSGLKRLDYRTGATREFDFGAETQVGEPVFAARPEGDGGVELDQGWLIAQCLDGKSEKTFFAVFDAETVDRGPVAKIWLEHHVPISFHGAWDAAA